MRYPILTALLVVSVCIAQAQTPDNTIPPDSLKQDSSPLDNLKQAGNDAIPLLSLDENDLAGDNNQSSVASLLTASRDPFYNAASFNWNMVRFRLRGYEPGFSGVYLNGVRMNDLNSGAPAWTLWSGLNDIFRAGDLSLGNHHNTFAFGDLGSSLNFDVRASRQKKQTSFSYALSNRAYTHRFMITHRTGFSQKGWAFSVSASSRFASQGYVPGTYYKGLALFAAIDKKIGKKQMISVIAFASPAEAGRQLAATQEMMSLAGTHYYNPGWGYQNGRVRNANVSIIKQPVLMLSHEYRINDKTTLSSSLLYSFGSRSLSGIDWYHASDPRPDYYRYLPSWYEINKNSDAADAIRNRLQTHEEDRQINWNNLYSTNRDNTSRIENVDGIEGNNIEGHRSFYIVGDRITRTQRLAANITVNTHLANRVELAAGLGFQGSRSRYFQRVNDLLGGDFWFNINPFAERDFPLNYNAYQYDVDHPNRIVTKGEKYGYDYNININHPYEWLQLSITGNRIDIHAAAEISQTKFWREGHVRNGLFPDHSFGKSSVFVGDNYALKAELIYKVNGRQYAYVNGSLSTRSPYPSEAFISPRTRDFLQPNLQNQSITNGELGYIINAPKIRLRASGYYTATTHGFRVMTFYYDDYQNFVNYALSNIGKLYIGSEWGADIKLTRSLSLTVAASLGRYYFNSRQHAVVTVDNTAEVITETTVYAKNFKVPGTPQEAYSASLTYRSPKQWFVSITGNYVSQMWLDFNPLRRTYEAVESLANDDAKTAVLKQMKWPGQATFDAYGGYVFPVKHRYVGKSRRRLYVSLNAGLSNITNNRNIVNNGYEQLRYDFSSSLEDNLIKFPTKYTYAFGFTYFISTQIRF